MSIRFKADHIHGLHSLQRIPEFLSLHLELRITIYDTGFFKNVTRGMVVAGLGLGISNTIFLTSKNGSTFLLTLEVNLKVDSVI